MVFSLQKEKVNFFTICYQIDLISVNLQNNLRSPLPFLFSLQFSLFVILFGLTKSSLTSLLPSLLSPLYYLPYLLSNFPLGYPFCPVYDNSIILSFHLLIYPFCNLVHPFNTPSLKRDCVTRFDLPTNCIIGEILMSRAYSRSFKKFKI